MKIVQFYLHNVNRPYTTLYYSNPKKPQVSAARNSHQASRVSNIKEKFVYIKQ